jgi:hypothetical protein
MAKGYKTGGRRKGTPNKLTRDLREMILGALADAGGRAYLVAQARKNPGSFLRLVGKLLPRQAADTDEGPVKEELPDVEIARRLAFLLARGAQALDCQEPDGNGIGAAVGSSIRHCALGLNSLTTSAPSG